VRREIAHHARWRAAKMLPAFGDRLGVDMQADVDVKVRRIDQMTMLDKAQAIQYALSKAKKLELPAPTEPKEREVNPAPLTTTVDHVRLLSPTPRPAPEVHDPDEDEVLL
jgi:hypothetical protein